MLLGATGTPVDEHLLGTHLGAHVGFSDRTEVLVLNEWSAEVYGEDDGRPIASASNDKYEKRKLFGVPICLPHCVLWSNGDI